MLEDNKQEFYEKYMKEINDRIKSNQEAQDKMILAVSVAFLGLMPFLLDKLPITCGTKILIILVLICNALSLITTLLSFYICSKGNKADIQYATEYYLNNKQDSLNKQSRWTKIGIYLNSCSLILFALFLILFVIILINYFINKG